MPAPRINATASTESAAYMAYTLSLADAFFNACHQGAGHGPVIIPMGGENSYNMERALDIMEALGGTYRRDRDHFLEFMEDLVLEFRLGRGNAWMGIKPARNGGMPEIMCVSDIPRGLGSQIVNMDRLEDAFEQAHRDVFGASVVDVPEEAAAIQRPRA